MLRLFTLLALVGFSMATMAQKLVNVPSSNLQNQSSISLQQSNDPCGFDHVHQKMLQVDPNYASKVYANELAIAQLSRSRLQKSGTVDTIPVVVHIIHTGQSVGTGANISMTQINSAITALNDRYSNSNNQSVDVEIHFELAKRDPDGNATTGVNRIDGSGLTGYSSAGVAVNGNQGADEQTVKNLSRWPNTQYYNVWVITEIDDNDGLFGIQGFAYFPGASPAVDGTMIMHTCFGTTGTVNSFNNLNRTFVHELGHGLNLYHTFQGDVDGTTCPTGNGDEVADTDPHIRAASNCPTGTNSCTGNSIDDETANFMNYSSQSCAVKFTAGQKTRMQSALDVGRPSLMTSLGHRAPSANSVLAASCTPSTSNVINGFGFGIYEVSLSNVFVVSSGTVNEGDYVDQTNHQLIKVDPGTNYPITIETGPANNEDVRIYIDYNNDGDFLDAGENVFSSDNALVHNGSISIPSSGITTNTPIRMRVIGDWFQRTITDACYNPTYGQTEDYSLFIQGTTLSVRDSIIAEISCNGGNDGSITSIASGGTAPYTYIWSTASNSPTISNLSSGSYTVTVTDNNGTTATATAFLSAPTPLNIFLSPQEVSCFGADDGAIIPGPSGGTPFYTYSWSNGNNSQGFTNVSAGLYTVTLSDANGCTVVQSALVTEPDSISIQLINLSDASCSFNADGSISISASGGVGSYSYDWSNSDFSPNISGLSSGNYTVTVTDANFCIAVRTFSVNAPDQLFFTLSSTDISCNGAADGMISSSVSGGTPPYTYDWDDGASSPNRTNLALSGIYELTVTDANGCDWIDNAFIFEPTAISVNFSANDISCNGANDGQISLFPSGGIQPYTIDWSSNAVDTAALGSGTYSFTLTDGIGCTVSNSVSISEPPILTANAVVDRYLNCGGGGSNNGRIEAIATGGTTPYSYQWDNMSGGKATNRKPQNLSAGTYNLTVTDANGCTATSSVDLGNVTLIDSLVATSTLCPNSNFGEARVFPSNSGSTPYTYAWSNGGTTPLQQSLNAGTYTVTVTDNNGCTDVASATISQSSFTTNVFISGQISCNNGSDGEISSTVSGGTSPYTYSWSSGGTSATINSLSAGTYTLTVTDANGCVNIDSQTLTDPTAITAPLLVNSISCFGGSDGSLQANPTGGTPPYTYNWSNGSSSSLISNLSAGTYSITITDANNCILSRSFTFNVPTQLTASADVDQYIGCGGGGSNSGRLEANASGGTSPYSYQWDNMSGGKATNRRPGNLSAGTYNLTVTDANGCTATSSVDLGTVPLIDSLVATKTVCDFSSPSLGEARVFPSNSGSTPYTYAWSNGGTTPLQQSLNAGTYTVTVTDNNGCTEVASSTISSSSLHGVVFVADNISCNGGSDGRIWAEGLGGVLPYTYSWPPPVAHLTGQEAIGLSAGMYTVTITDSVGCSYIDAPVLVDPQALTATLNITSPISCFNGNDGETSSSVSGGTAPYTYSWSNGSNTANNNNLSAGTYTLTVTDANGCTATSSESITEPSEIQISLNPVNVTCGNTNDGSITTSISGGTVPYVYLWSNSSIQNQISNISSGTYTLTVTDFNGCTNTATAIVSTDSCNNPINLTLRASDCGATNVDPLYQTLVASGTTNASAYRFRINGGSLNNFVLNTGSNFFFKTNQAGLAYGTTYTVEVAAFINGGWSNYGSSCSITTSSIGTAVNLSLRASDCGATNVDPLYQNIVAQGRPDATAYRFRINGGSLNNFVLNSGTNFFFKTIDAGLAYGTTYTVEVAALIAGSWSNYGTPCSITTASIQNTVNLTLRASDCGATNVDPLFRNIVANGRPDATAYRFRINGGAISNLVLNTGANFFFKTRDAGLVNSTTYAVEVAAFIGGSWSNFGTPCNITTAPPLDNLRMAKNYSDDKFELINFSLYPNPASRNTVVNLSYQREGDLLNPVTIRVYSIDGRMIYENRLQSDQSNFQHELGNDIFENKGIFLIYLDDGDRTFTEKLIVQ